MVIAEAFIAVISGEGKRQYSRWITSDPFDNSSLNALFKAIEREQEARGTL